MYKEISRNTFKNKITYNIFSYKSYMYDHLIACKHMTDAKLLVFHSTTRNHLTVYKQMSSSLSENDIYKLFVYKSNI